jgi:enamine deaminase RidA (YjgF/YER057c/UK114 family)
MDDIVKVAVFLRDASHLDSMDRVYREYFGAGQERATATVQTPSPIAGADTETDVAAAVPA